MGPTILGAVARLAVHVVLLLQCEGVRLAVAVPQHEPERGEVAAAASLAHTQLLLQHVDQKRRPHDQRAAGVEHGPATTLATTTQVQRLAINSEVRQRDLPVAGLRDVGPNHGRRRPVLAPATECQLRAVMEAAPEEEGEDRLLHYLGVNERAEEIELASQRDVGREAHDAIPARLREGLVGLLQGLDKVGLGAQAANNADALAGVLAPDLAGAEGDVRRVPVVWVLRRRAVGVVIDPSDLRRGLRGVRVVVAVRKASGGLPTTPGGQDHVPGAGVK
mmetsp:Transcript_26180/g.75505  ORF Transcript_26180/g.75505 Transcript_26180/m.75505 type:complete len:277 (-) Transcript_26180:306-1136(-)